MDKLNWQVINRAHRAHRSGFDYRVSKTAPMSQADAGKPWAAEAWFFNGTAQEVKTLGYFKHWRLARLACELHLPEGSTC